MSAAVKPFGVLTFASEHEPGTKVRVPQSPVHNEWYKSVVEPATLNKLID